MITELESQLNDFSPLKRAEALEALIAADVQYPDEQEVVNLHCHTFFSFNAYGYSPTALAWLAKQKGYKALGIVDFDVLDAVDEFLDTCERVALRGSAGIETRVYLRSSPHARPIHRANQASTTTWASASHPVKCLRMLPRSWRICVAALTNAIG